MGKLFVRITGKEGRSPEVLANLRAKSKRRALRHFRGQEVKHRVVRKDANSIELAFMRSTGKPLSFRWRYEATPPAKTKAAKPAKKTAKPRRKTASKR